MTIPTSSLSIFERPWYRATLWVVAISALIAFLYVAATSHGWVSGEPARWSTVLLLGSSTAMLWGQLALHRKDALGLLLQVVAGALLVWSIAALGTGG